ncbi:MAG: heavy metal-responsive transcriptional regulator [Dehalococcoidia bacterium]|nr:heavy metal-responsive transcriptional regulator [Dehalococcoidia bacterium]
MKIGEVSKATGLTAKTIRFYEGERLLPDPGRTPSGYRVYGPNDIARLDFICKAKTLGLSLAEIKSVLVVHGRSDPTCLHVRSLLDAKLAQVDSVLADLQEFRAEIVRLSKASENVVDCRPAGGRICGIIEGSEIVGPGKALSWMTAKPGVRPRKQAIVRGRAE